jgi:hypothetical protein
MKFRCIRLTTLPPSRAECLQKSGSINLLDPHGPSRPVQGSCYFFFLPTKTTLKGPAMFIESLVTKVCQYYSKMMFRVTVGKECLNPLNYKLNILQISRSVIPVVYIKTTWINNQQWQSKTQLYL